MSLLKSALPFSTNQAARFISRGIGRSFFSGNFLLSFLLCYDYKILVKSRVGYIFKSSIVCKNLAGVIFLSLESRISHLSFSWSGRNNSEFDVGENEQKPSKFPLLFKVFIILPPLWLSSLGSDVSINNIVRLGSADTKSERQNVVKVLELTELQR